jgi:glutathione peroxidase
MTTRVHDFPATGLDGRPMPLSAWAGKPLLIVNVASQCGYTPQYKGLEQLWKDLGPRGLVVISSGPRSRAAPGRLPPSASATTA